MPVVYRITALSSFVLAATPVCCEVTTTSGLLWLWHARHFESYILLIVPLLKPPAIVSKPTVFFLANHLEPEVLAERTEPAQRLAARARRLQEARRRRISAYRGGHSALAADGTPLDYDVEVYECRETRVGASEKAHDSCWGGAAAGGGPDLWLRRHQPPTQGHLEQVWMLLAQ